MEASSRHELDWDRVDSVRVEVRLVPHWTESANEVWVAEFHNPERLSPAWSRDWLAQQVNELAYKDGQPVPHILDVHQSQFDWGAGGASYSVILHISDWIGSGVVGAAAFEAFKKLMSLMRARQHEKGISDEDAPMDLQEAIARAQFSVARAYDLDDDQLESLSESHDIEAGTWVVTLEDPQGNHYEVSLGITEGLPMLRRIIRYRSSVKPGS